MVRVNDFFTLYKLLMHFEDEFTIFPREERFKEVNI